ncbi:conserved hypothetical protein [Ricinus communis]|uniref:Uncharacterized protein n=1 Tax=Ricinus communis TaxID=3988 RepID=B9TEQ6_RICCO|nr:conserved hypothetical protein [Ricinus communis]
MNAVANSVVFFAELNQLGEFGLQDTNLVTQGYLLSLNQRNSNATMLTRQNDFGQQIGIA